MTSPYAPSTVRNPNICISRPDWQQIARAAVFEHDCQQLPAELATLLGLLDCAVKPSCVLEIGSWRGGSAWAWSQLPSVCRVVSVTSPDGPEMASTVRQGVTWSVIRGDSRDPATVIRARAALPADGAGMVFIDADHTLAAATLDWRNYGPMVERGGLVVFHDINRVPHHPDIQVDRLWDQLAAYYPSLALVAGPGELGGTGILLR